MSQFDDDQSPLNSTFDRIVEEAMKEWHVPGMSVAVLNGDKTFAKGYGISTFPREKVTLDTLFYAASTTKSFTAAAVSLLIDDGASIDINDIPAPDLVMRNKLEWTTPLSTIIPADFILPDAYATQHVTLEDALSHRTGMPDHEKSFGPRSTSVRDAVRGLRHLPATAELRQQFIYNCVVYTAVTHAVETITCRSLGTLLRERIWEPLAMKNTFWTLQEALTAEREGRAQLATGYAWDPTNSQYVKEPHPDFPAVSGSGAIISTVLDYSKWLRCMMTRSGPLSPTGHAAVVKPRIVYSAPGNNPYTGDHLYGLGWFVDTYRGEKIIWHSGGWTGFGSVMAFLPGRQWGFAMMGNTSRTSNYVQIIAYFHLLDELLDTPMAERIDWNLRLKEKVRQRRADFAQTRETLYPSLPQRALRPSLGLEKYSRSYFHPTYGMMSFIVVGPTLVADRSQQEIPMTIRMEHVSGEFWLATLAVLNRDERDMEIVRAEFQVSADGESQSFGIDLEPRMNGEKIWFTKVPARL